MENRPYPRKAWRLRPALMAGADRLGRKRISTKGSLGSRRQIWRTAGLVAHGALAAGGTGHQYRAGPARRQVQHGLPDQHVSGRSGGTPAKPTLQLPAWGGPLQASQTPVSCASQYTPGFHYNHPGRDWSQAGWSAAYQYGNRRASAWNCAAPEGC